MKVGPLIANIEFIHPEGELEKYKYGVVPKAAASVSKDSEQLVQTDYKALKKELSSPATKPKADFEIVDGKS